MNIPVPFLCLALLNLVLSELICWGAVGMRRRKELKLVETFLSKDLFFLPCLEVCLWLVGRCVCMRSSDRGLAVERILVLKKN